jgi:hypothetical protein
VGRSAPADVPDADAAGFLTDAIVEGHETVAPRRRPAARAAPAGGLVVLTGREGLGKTTVCRTAARDLDRRTLQSLVFDPPQSIDRAAADLDLAMPAAATRTIARRVVLTLIFIARMLVRAAAAWVFRDAASRAFLLADGDAIGAAIAFGPPRVASGTSVRRDGARPADRGDAAAGVGSGGVCPSPPRHCDRSD